MEKMGSKNYINGITDKFAVNKAYKSDFVGYQPVGFERNLKSKTQKNVDFVQKSAEKKVTDFMKEQDLSSIHKKKI